MGAVTSGGPDAVLLDLSTPPVCKPTPEGCACLPHLGKSSQWLEKDHAEVRSAVLKLWRFKKVLPFKEFPAAHEGLFQRRGRAAQDLVLPHLQAGLELVADACHALSMRADPEGPDVPAAASPGPVDVGVDVDALVRRHLDLASITITLLVTDHHTWSKLVEEIERNGWADLHLRRLLARRRNMGELHGLEADDPRMRKSATATLSILDAIVDAECPLTLAGADRELFLSTQTKTKERVELVRAVEFKAEQAQKLARRHDALTAERRRKLHARTPRPQRRRPPGTDAEARRAARRAARQAVQRVEGEVARFVAGYTITSTELRSFDWTGLGQRLTGGACTDERDCPGFPKTQVRDFFGLLKFVVGRRAAGADPQAVVDALATRVDAEDGLREQVAGVLAKHRQALSDDGQAVALLAKLHLRETRGWLVEHWAEVEWLLAEAAPHEHAALAAVVEAGR